MCFRTFGKVVIVAVVLAVLHAPAVAEEEEERPRKTFSSLINVDALVDNYIRFVARKYDLTDDQDAYTEQLVRARVDDFLARHQDELTGLVDRLVDVRTGGDIAPEELIAWGRRMQPIYLEAKEVIVETNDEWREILTEAQRRIHDEDVKLMYQSFTTTEDQIDRLMAGEMTVEEFRNPRRARDAASRTARKPTPTPLEQPAAKKADDSEGQSVGDMVRARASRQSASRRSSPRTSARRTSEDDEKGVSRASRGQGRAARKGGAAAGAAKDGHESKWEQYVRQFIDRYALDAEQQTRANKILKKCQEQADRYLRARKVAFEKLDRREEALKTSTAKDKTKQMAAIRTERTKLLSAVDDIFEKQLKPRLERIPTRAQREAAGKRGTQKASSARRPSQADKPAPQPVDEPEEPVEDPEADPEEGDGD